MVLLSLKNLIAVHMWKLKIKNEKNFQNRVNTIINMTHMLKKNGYSSNPLYVGENELNFIKSKYGHGTKRIQDNYTIYLMFIVFTQAKYQCYFCGTIEGDFTLDHLLPLTAGGQHDYINVACVCKQCNFEKNLMTEDEYRTFLIQKGKRVLVKYGILKSYALRNNLPIPFNKSYKKRKHTDFIQMFHPAQDWMKNRSLNIESLIQPKLCVFCGHPIKSTSKRTKFCSKRCGLKYHQGTEEIITGDLSND